MLGANCLREPKPAYEIDVNVNRDAAQARDATLPESHADAAVVDTEPPRDAVLEAPPQVPSDGPVTAPGDASTAAETGPVDTTPSPLQDAAADSAKDAEPDARFQAQ